MTDVLRLAVDARDVASDTRGIGRYVRAILRRLVQRSDVALTLLVRGPLPFLQRSALQRTLGSGNFRVSGSAARCDAVWHPANGTFFSSDLPNVVTIHDAVPFRFPQADPARRAHEQRPFLLSARTASRVIAVSSFDRHEIMDVFGIAPDRISVIHHGVEPFFSPGNGESSVEGVAPPYLLFVGDPIAEPRKNFSLLYQAYRRAFQTTGGPTLVVVGQANPNVEAVAYAGLAAGDASGSGDARLRALYRGAAALCVPSSYETFGMPMIEAMACGTPVLASTSSCLPEIGGEAALYAPADDADAWAHALRAIVHDASLRERLRKAGLGRAKRYSWEDSVRRHLEVFTSPS